jgi:hypothetical protein
MPPGFYLVADTAFPRGVQSIEGRIRAPVKAGNKLRGTRTEIEDALHFDRQLLSYRQTAEWGNRGLQGSFGRLRVLLEVAHKGRWGDLLETCVRAFNLRCRRVGFNQIRSVYASCREIELGTWKNFESILFSDQRCNDHVARFHTKAVYD